MTKLSDMLGYLRRREGLSQDELASRLGMSRSTIGMYETGKREPELETLEAFADFYNVDMDTLTGHRVSTGNEDTDAVLQALHDTPGLRVMFDVSKNRSEEDIRQAVEIIKAFYRTKDELV